MLRVLRRKCFYCLKFHEKPVQMKTYFSTRATEKVEIECGGNSKLEISTGQLARLADGTAVARLGNTSVMTTVVSKGKPSAQGFLPLTVDYRQKAAAAGRIPTNYLRRELGASEREILVGRMIDRSIRPLFSQGYQVETGLNCNLLSVDGIHDPEVLSINGASAALSISDVPWGPAVGAVRLGYCSGQILVNPTRKELTHSELNLVVAGTRDGLATMLEGEAKCLDHKTFIEAIQVGLEHCARIALSIESLGEKVGRKKREVGGETTVQQDQDLLYLVDTLCTAKLRAIYTDYSLDKQSRDGKMFKVRDEMITQVKSIKPEAESSILSDIFSSVSKTIIRNLIFQVKIFSRKWLSILCMHYTGCYRYILGGVKEKNFMLHYEFPGYATGELGRGGSRRELGHGALAEKALRQVLPSGTPFTIRLTSEVLESNGSSSMASICGGSMALLDAGLPLSELASGVAMGLVSREGEEKVLTDIMGMEDYLGDMDFKLAATRSGVCALQADVKLPGISLDVIKEAVEGGIQANHKILDIMSACIQEPREYKDCWPVSRKLEVPSHKRGKFLGQAGLNVRRITQETGVQIFAEAEGTWQLFAPNPDSMAEAETIIENILAEEKVPELEFGGIYSGRITEILDRGVMLELHEGISPVLLHNSQLSAQKIQHPSVLGLKVGENLQVKYYGRDPATGQMRLSRKVLAVSSAAAVKNLQKSTKPLQSSAKREDVPDNSAINPPLRPRLQINENRADFFSPQEPDPRHDQPRREPVLTRKDLFLRPKNVQKEAFKVSSKVPETSVEENPEGNSNEVNLQENSNEVNLEAKSNEVYCEEKSNEVNLKAKSNKIYCEEKSNEVNLEAKNNKVNLEEKSNEVNLEAKNNKVNLEEKSNEVNLEAKSNEVYCEEKSNEVYCEEEDSNEVYYEVDRLLNKLMAISMEIKDASQRKENVDREWGFVKEALSSIEQSSNTSRILSQAFNSDKIELCKKFSTQSKAINETLLLLTRQYRDIKEELETAKRIFIKHKIPEKSASDLVKDDEVCIISEPESGLDLESKLGSEHVSSGTERYNREVISDLVKETLSPPYYERMRRNNSYEPGVSSWEDPARHFNADDLLTRDIWTKPIPFLSNPDLELTQPQPHSTQYSQSKDSKVDSELKPDLKPDLKSSSKNLSSKETLTLYLSNMQIEKKSSKTSNLAKKKVNVLHAQKTRMKLIEEISKEMDNIHERFSCGTDIPSTLKNDKVSNIVRKNCQDFNTLVRWLSQLDNFNAARLKDVTEGAKSIHRSLKKNLENLDVNKKFLNYNSSAIKFIGRHLGKPDHPLVGLAQKNTQKLAALYEQNLEFLARDCSLHSRQDQNPNIVWEEYCRLSHQLKQITDRLWDIELSEERVADLDDWREESRDMMSSSLQYKLEMIDEVQERIDGFTKFEMEKNWSNVEKNIHVLQGLKVEGLQEWLSSTQSLPDWISQELKDHLLERCDKYLELETNRKQIQNSWLNLRGKDDSLNLSLDVLYSQMRTCFAKVKYSYLENRRHRSEISTYFIKWSTIKIAE
ncbi:polyribonucleotide nucleotidyltransferase 2, mitochondrial [Eurytemora carolleeae]|uniref:polyribonucleotide nucleotidyltransferase 2, mitochondrial n=1 Tax=Eurytemora carolleeae TaxID=1294199 RepID=UPI000C7719A8|nr:polyribonucleotide nucleotidyltransferase 2, mitochondrial [Eurytemora carolleeae]|eukprot:XP_023328029.1 polyribonucleotide nucleotidyltransferase 2, mitochondrial-like [Eurytemora affinis]